MLARPVHVCRGDVLAAVRGLAGNDQQRLELVGDGGALRVALHARDEVLVAVQVVGRDGAMDGLTVPAVVPRRHERRNQLALAGRERVRTPQQNVHQLVQRLGRLGPESHRAANSRKALGQGDVRHGSSVADVAA